MKTTYMKKVRDFWPFCEAFINGEWQSVTRAEHVREYSRDTVTIYYGYGSHEEFPGDYKIRWRG